jgi:hypothetical protein
MLRGSGRRTGPHAKARFDRLPKILRRLLTAEQLFGEKQGGLKPGVYAARCILLSKKEAREAMPIFKYFGVAGSALLVFLFVSYAYLGDSESNSRFNGSLYESALYAPRLADIASTAERHFTRDARPANRVKEVFAQFVPNEGKRGKRYSSAETFVR